VPEIIDRLVALGAEDPALSGVRVSDGPEVTETSARDWLVVGFDGDPSGDFQAAQTVGGWAGLGTRTEEEFQITVAAIAQRGDTSVRAARARVYEIGARVEAWLREDPTIGLPSLEALIGASRLVQAQTDQGVQVVLLLTVAGRAFT
jgi:hypothetical protein